MVTTQKPSVVRFPRTTEQIDWDALIPEVPPKQRLLLEAAERCDYQGALLGPDDRRCVLAEIARGMDIDDENIIYYHLLQLLLSF